MPDLPNFDIARIEEFVRAAGKLILKDFKRGNKISFIRKADESPVTRADLESQAFIEQQLKQYTPDIPVFGEEQSTEEFDRRLTGGQPESFWIIDPIDGTQNYALGIDFFCISVGLIHQKDVVLGIIYDPVRDELFSAHSGKGAFLNGESIAANGEKKYNDYMVCVQMRWMKNSMRRFVADFLAEKVDRIREAGSTALKLAWIACGRYDADIQDKVNFWDSAAGILIVRESGGICTDFLANQIEISPRGQHELIAASTKHLHQWIIEHMKAYQELKD